LKRFGVPGDVPFGKLSKGQKAQVALALALASAPKLLVLDDPTLGLDAVARKAVFEELIGELADRGTTVFITTHDLAGVERIADRVAVLRQGKLVLDEEMETLKNRFRRLSFSSGEPQPRLEALAPVAVASRGWGIEAVVAHYDEERWGVAGPEGPEVSALTLEEIFIALTGEPEEAGR
jgi:ABC-2 type transport system ATP-binding protein